MSRQHGNIFTPFAQGWECDHSEGETVEQILAEFSVGSQLRQINVRCCHQAHIDLQRLAAAESFDFAVFCYAQEFFLHVHRSIGQFIQKQRAVVGTLKIAFLGFGGAGECTSFMAKQLRFEQVFVERGAIEFQKFLFPAP